MNLLHEALHAINEQYDPEAIALFVEWKMLPVAGIHPILHQCANCSATEGEFAFSFKEIGFLCHRCFHMDKYLIRISPTQLKLIRTFYTVPINRVGNLTLKKTTKQFMKKLVRTIYDEQVGIRLKSRSFLDQLESTPELLPRKEKPEEEGDKPTFSGLFVIFLSIKTQGVLRYNLSRLQSAYELVPWNHGDGLSLDDLLRNQSHM